MGDKQNWLLTDEFVEFSAKVAEIYDKKKKAKAELKEIYERYQAEFRELDADAKKLQDQFDSWKESQNEENE